MENENRLAKQIEYLDLLLETGKQIDQATLEKIRSEEPELYEILLQSNQLRNPKLVKPNPLYVTSSKTRIFHQVYVKEKERAPILGKITGIFSLPRVPKLSFSPALTIILVLVMCFSLFVGGAQAADKTRPGDFLYPVDQALESAQLMVTINNQARLQLLLSFADERLEEADEGFAADDLSSAELALEGYEREMNSINSLLEDEQIEFSDELLVQVEETQRNNTIVLTNLLEKVPESAQEAIQHAIEVSGKPLKTQPAGATESTKTPPGLEDKDTPPGLDDNVPPGQEDKEDKPEKTPPGLEDKDKEKKTPPGLENKDNKD